jgi:hypothetical protein
MNTFAQNSIRIAVWNCQWAKPGSTKHSELLRRINLCDVDVICLTETYENALPASWQTITSHPDYGYRILNGRRKVLIASCTGWQSVDQFGHTLMPGGRFVAGQVSTPIGPVRFIGVCIPWRDAHVRTGRSDRKLWEDHLQFLDGLKHFLDSLDRSVPTVLLGDFNQRIPRYKQPKYIYDRLSEVLSDNFQIATAGPIHPIDKLSIDHVAHTTGMQLCKIKSLSNLTDDCRPLSDHFGLSLTLAL